MAICKRENHLRPTSISWKIISGREYGFDAKLGKTNDVFKNNLIR